MFFLNDHTEMDVPLGALSFQSDECFGISESFKSRELIENKSAVFNVIKAVYVLYIYTESMNSISNFTARRWQW